MKLFQKIIHFFRRLFRKKDNPKQNKPENEQRIFHHVIFKDPFGIPNLTHEIDRIIVRRNGVFCIEDKTWKGKVYGFEDDGPWRQVFGEKHTIRSHPSPILQNDTHKKVLEEILDKRTENYVIPVVVMTENNSPLHNGKKVINAQDLKQFMDTHSSVNPPWNKTQFLAICSQIEKADCSTTITRKEHVQNIRSFHSAPTEYDIIHTVNYSHAKSKKKKR